MSLEEVYFVSQSIAAVAIVASLFYVILQLRETHRNQRALVQQGRAARNTSLTLRQTEEDMAELLAKFVISDGNWASMNDVQLIRLIGWSRAMLFHFEDSYLQHVDGLMDTRAFESSKKSIANIFARLAIRAVWDLTRSFHTADFAACIDKIIDDTPQAATRDLVGIWKTKMKELTAEPQRDV